MVIFKPVEDNAKDGKLYLLRVRNGEHPLEDSAEGDLYTTIGFNTLKDTGEDEWKLVGWCWSHDHFVDEPKAEVVSYCPLPLEDMK